MAEPNGLEARLRSEWEALRATAPSGESPLLLPPERRRPASRVALGALLEEVREEWSRLRDRIDDATARRFVNAGWTLKDLLAHLASWASEFRREVETVRRGESFDYAIPFALTVAGPNRWNEEQVRARRERSLSAIFEEYERETLALQELLAELDEAALYQPTELPLAPTGDPAVRFRAPAAMILAGKCEHDRHHFAQIRDRLRRWKRTGS